MKNTITKDDVQLPSKEKIIALISALIPEAKILIYGSRARGTHREWSDIDIALDTGTKINQETIGELNSLMAASNIPYKIDIVDLNGISKDFREAILKETVKWK